jgi:hypothetical protein
VCCFIIGVDEKKTVSRERLLRLRSVVVIRESQREKIFKIPLRVYKETNKNKP